MKKLTVGELRKALDGVPDDLEVELLSDSGVDQGDGIVIIESAIRITYKTSNGFKEDYFAIYANDIDTDEEDYE